MKANDNIIIATLRGNCRETLTKMSRQTNIPVTTLYEKIREYRKDLISKFTSIVNFDKLGYRTKAHIILKPSPETKKAVEEFLMQNKSVNSLYKVGTSFDYLAEVVCKDMQEFHDFLNKLESMNIAEKEVLFVVDDMRREDFLSQPCLPLIVGA